MAGKAGFKHSTLATSKYKPKVVKHPKYESYWGTVSKHDSRQFVSLTMAKHPIIAWATTLRTYAERHGTKAELEAVYDLLMAIDRLDDFVGVKSFKLTVESAGIRASARIVRL